MCSSLSNFVVLLKIIRLVIPISLITIGTVLLYDRKKFYDKRKYKKYTKKYIIMLIVSISALLLSTFAIFLIGDSGVCDGRFIDLGSDIKSNLVHYSHLVTYILIIIFTIFILYIILSSLSKKMDNKKEVFLTKFIEIFIVFAVLIGYAFISHEISINSKNNDKIEQSVTAWKPIMYIYPEEEMDLTINVLNSDKLIHTYPKYKDEWNIHVSTDGNIYDYNTERNYYALYWDEIDNSLQTFDEGFVVKGEDISKFFEEKLEILGFNSKEINEFIIYWMPKMEDNKYNLIKFRTTEEVNLNMPIEFSKNPDTLIRVIMDYKKLDEKIEIKEQKLEKQERVGFTIVEWGGRELK